MKPITIIIIGIVVILLCAVGVLAYLGYIPLNLDLISDDDMGSPPGSDYCGFSDGQILDMLETIAGKDLNNEAGLGFIDALNMRACGSDSKLPSEVEQYYRTKNAEDGWYYLGGDSYSGSGWTAISAVWGNNRTAVGSTLARTILSGNGISVKEYYGYNTITITSHGTRVSYLAFVAWLNAS